MAQVINREWVQATLVIILLGTVNSDAGRCTECGSLMNRNQCVNNGMECFWTTSNQCQEGSMRILATASKLSTSTVNTSTVNESTINEARKVSSKIVNSSTVNTSSIVHSQQCAGYAKSKGVCQGYEKSTGHPCLLNSLNECVGVDATQDCSYFTTRLQCALNQKCHYYVAQYNTKAKCRDQHCEDFLDQSKCIFIITSYDGSSATACKWAQADGYPYGCVDGQASDLSLSNCESPSYTYYTYSDAQQVCAECHGYSGTSIIQSTFCALLIVFIGL